MAAYPAVTKATAPAAVLPFRVRVRPALALERLMGPDLDEEALAGCSWPQLDAAQKLNTSLGAAILKQQTTKPA